jgi:hypothetical protein
VHFRRANSILPYVYSIKLQQHSAFANTSRRWALASPRAGPRQPQRAALTGGTLGGDDGLDIQRPQRRRARAALEHLQPGSVSEPRSHKIGSGPNFPLQRSPEVGPGFDSPPKILALAPIARGLRKWNFSPCQALLSSRPKSPLCVSSARTHGSWPHLHLR